MLKCWKSGTVWQPFPNRARKPCLLRLPGSSKINEVFQLRHRSLLTRSRCGLLFGAALPFPHNWEEILIFSVFWFCGCFVLVYWKAKNINLHCYLPASFSEPSDCMISDNRGIYDVMSQKTTTDSPESVSQCQAEGVAATMLGAGGDRGDRCRASTLWDWFYCEVNCMNIVTKEEKKSLLETDTTVSSSKATGRACKASRAGLSWSHRPDRGSSLMRQVLGAMWWPVTILSQCLALAFIFLIN